MNCPDCDSLMFKEECPCGFKVPPVSTIEIKQMGAQESTAPKAIDEKAVNALSGTNLTGRAYAEFCVKYCMDVLKKASSKNQQELLRRNRHVN